VREILTLRKIERSIHDTVEGVNTATAGAREQLSRAPDHPVLDDAAQRMLEAARLLPFGGGPDATGAMPDGRFGWPGAAPGERRADCGVAGAHCAVRCPPPPGSP
jgi:hypothetical protein